MVTINVDSANVTTPSLPSHCWQRSYPQCMS